MSSWSSFGKTPSGPPSSNSNSNAVPRAPTTTMTKVRPADRGEAPATEPGAVRADSGLQHHPAGQQETRVSASTGTATATAADDGNRREARRSKRAATREKMGRASVNSETILRTSAVSAAPGEARASIISRNNIEYISDDDDDDDDDDGVNGETPGSWAVAGPTVRRSQQQQAAASGKAMLKPIDDEADNLADGGATVDGGANDTNEKNLPVAFEAEVVFDYPTNNNSINNVVVAQKDDGGRVVPLKWLVIGGCFMFIAAVAISVGLGVALGGDNGDSSKDAAVVGPTDPVAPTFTPVEAPTFTPVVAPSYAPVEPGSPTFAPVVPPTFTPVAPPTFTPVTAPTFTPVVPPTFVPVVAPTFAPVVAPTFPPVVAPTFPPVVDPTFPPVVAPTVAPTVAPVPAPVTAPPVASPDNGGNPLYPGGNGLTCQCRFYSQDIVVSDAVDYSNLDGGELSGFIQILLRMVNVFDPYGFNRRDRRMTTTTKTGSSSLRGGADRRLRELEPTSLSFALDLTSQTRFGTAGTNPFGVQMVYEFEFCLDDSDFLGEYHAAFVNHLSSNSGNLAQMETDVRNLGISSLTELTVPDELQDRVCSGRRRN